MALNPHTPAHVLEDVIHDIDVICVMSVNPGFGGQSFIEHTYKKVASLKKMIQEQQTNTLIEIDGGVSLKNAAALIQEGADVLVAGSFVFRAEKPLDTIQALKSVQVEKNSR